MASRIEQVIEEIEDYIEGCKPQTFSSTKIVVNKEQMEELLTELRTRIPEEIKRYQKIISNKEAILADAQTKAEAIIAQAQVKTDELINEHQIMQQAYAQANDIVMLATEQAKEILDNATNDANDIRMGAMQYTNDILKNLEDAISHSMDAAKSQHDSYINSLQGFLDVVSANRAELTPIEEEEETSKKNEELPNVQISSDMLGNS